MNSLNQKKRLISIFQFIGVYLLGFLLMGFAISSFRGVTADEKDALNQRITELEKELNSNDSLLRIERKSWKTLTQKAFSADTLANRIQNLEKVLKDDLGLGPAGDINAARRLQEIELIQSRILNEFVNSLESTSDTSLQGRMRNYLNNAYRNMIAAKSSFRALQDGISQDNTDDALQLENADLQARLNRMEMDQKVGNKLNSCEQRLGQVKEKMETFSGSAESYAGSIKEISTELQAIQNEIKNLLGKNRKEKEKMDRKIENLKRLAGDMTKMGTEMKAAAK